MTQSELKALMDANLADNKTKAITAEKLREVVLELVKGTNGYGDYANTLSAQSLTASTWTQLTNNGLGSDTNTDYLPYQSSGLLTSNEIDLEGLDVGRLVACRFQFTCDPTSTNDFIDFRVNFKNSAGVEQFQLQFHQKEFRTSSAKTFTTTFFFYIGSTIQNGSVALEANPNDTMSVKWDGVLVEVR